MKARILFLVLIILRFSAAAQQYPVQGSLIVTSPYPSYISDYANPAMEKLILNLICTDINLVNQRVRMKLSIYKGTSLLAKSTDVVINEPMVMLDGGVPLRLTSAELANYFKLENLQGIAPNSYAQTLPEGVYTITFQVFDYFTGNRLSGDIIQQFWLMLNDPPFLNAPLDKENIQQSSGINPQIAFQWTPRTTQVSNTEYTFQLVELWDDYGDPYQQFLASPPKYTAVTTNTTLLYGITEPPLIPGRRYAWRIQAKAKQGLDDIGLYRNDGYSNIYTFKYAGQCDAIQSVNGQVKSSDRIYLEWLQPPQVMTLAGSGQSGMYKVAYRKYSSSNQWEWAELPTTNGYINLTNLDGNTEYEIKVGNVCDNSLVGYSTPIRLRTQETGADIPANCGQAPTVDLSNKTLLQKLSVYDVVTATDFPITITRAEGNANGWSGEGWVKVPYLADTKIHVVYKGIKVNTDYKLIDGYFETAYNPNGSEIYDVDETVLNVKGIINDLKDLFAMTIDKDAKDIAKLTLAIKEEAAQEMPEALQQKMNAALDAVNNAKKEYDEAKMAYDNASTPQEKEEAKKKLDAAGEKFSKAMDDVKAAQKEQSDLVNNATKYLLAAIKKLKEEVDAMRQTNGNNTSQGNGDVTSDDIEVVILRTEAITQDQANIDAKTIDDFQTLSKQKLNKLAGNYFGLVKTLFSYYNDNSKNTFEDDNALKGKELVKYTIDQLQKKVPDQQLIQDLHDKIQVILITISKQL